MTKIHSLALPRLIALSMVLAVPLLPLSGRAASTDLASAPLETSTATLVKPNILFILDDSGSMGYAYLPDWAGDFSASSYPQLYRNSRFNGVYYDPAVTYTPPKTYSGSSYTSYNSSSYWTVVPVDGFGIQSTSTVNLTTSTSVPTVYYTFVPGEYCTAANLRTCNTQSAATTTYAYPAYLRWCTSSALSTCQATYVDTAISTSSGSVTYTNPRYPGMSSTATIKMSGSGSTSISSITVNGVQILSGTTTASSSTSSVASAIATAINNCTSSATGNCGAAGYSASASSSTVTITSPTGSYSSNYGYSPTVTKSGNMSATVTAFTGGTPGSWVKTTISSSTTSYPYPGTSAVATTRTDCASSSGCTYTEEMTNFANWYAYYHTRMQMMKTAASLSLIDLSTSYRLGYLSINNSTGSDFLDMADITTTSGGQKSKFYAKLFAAKPNSSTPLRTALSTAGRYFAGKLSTVNSVSATDPMQYACQRNYTLLSTDGYWNESATPYQINGSTAIGDQDGSSSGESRPYLDGNSVSNTLADVAEYYYATDIRSSSFSNTTNSSTGTDVSSNSYSNGQQRMYTYTLGLGASGYMLYDSSYASATSGDYYDVANGTSTSSSTQSAGTCFWQYSGSCNWPKPVSNTQTAIDDLWHAAINGRGAYYSATNPSELKTGLTNFVNAVSAATANSASATASSLNLSTSTSNYIYTTRFCSAKWFGDLAQYSIDASTGSITSTPNWSESGSGSDCTSASGALTTTALLDNQTWSDRAIYTYNPANTSSTLISFAWSSLTSTMQGYFKISAIASLSQLCSSGSTCLSSSAQVDSSTAGTTTGAGGINLVNYLRGDRSNEGSSTSKYYFPRTHVLGDIVNAQAAYVAAPTYSYTDTGYSEYKTNYASRTTMVYAGANDGMLHAFNASTGAETWAYIPSMLLPSLYKLADKNYASNHVNYVDGAITKADVYYDSAWHTILVGGLGQGGRGFYALDVTTPSSPQVLWEFTYDTSAGTGYIMDEDLGYSYGTPVVTKLSDGTWAVLVTSGYNNVSPGSGHGIVWVLNAQTGAIIKKIDTGMGSNASGSTVTGCSAVPCPAGLSKISAWVNSSKDNTALYVYGGDLYGNLWRMNIKALTASGGTVTTQLLATLSDSSSSRQPITTTPELGYLASSPIVYVGTGQYLGTSDVSTSQTQSIYAIKDSLDESSTSTALYSSPRSNLCSSSTTKNCFVQQVLSDSSGTRTATSTVDYAVDFSSMYGWFEDLPETGERINTDPALYNGTLVFASNIPTTSGACATGGSSYINYVSYSTGLAVGSSTSTGLLLSSTALAGGVTLVVTSSGALKGIVTTSDGSTSTTDVPTSSTSTGTRRVSWRELILGQ